MSLDEILVIEFLTMLFNNNESYSSINTARSALSCFLYNNTGISIGNYSSVKRFLKGVFESKPPRPRYSCIWDANIVLNYLGNFYPNEDMSLLELTYKLVMLLALITAQRAQTLHVLDLENIEFDIDYVFIRITDLLKQSNSRNMRLSWKLRFYDLNPSICVGRVLKEYIRRTEPLRKKEKQLLISFHKPFAAVARSTISRWIKKVLYEAGIDVGTFKAHSTRAASCSRAKKDGVPIENILRTAGWANNSTFEKFYNKCIIE